MKTNLTLLFLFMLTMLNSCISDEESARQLNSGFQGNWSGSFTGEEMGSITFVVQKEGTIVGEMNVLPSNTKETINGYVNFNGKFDMNTKSNYQFSGYLKDSKSNGSWKKNNLTGNFSFQKQ